MTSRIRVLVVDDEPLVRDGLSKILGYEHDIVVVGGASGAEAVDKAVHYEPDVVLMDIYMPMVSGLQAMPVIKQKLPNSRVLLLTVSDSEDDLLSALRLGAQGYLLKSEPVNQIIDGVRRTAAGETVLSPQLAGKLAAGVRHKTEERKLSEREKQVLGFLRDGLSNAEIARRLSVEESTVKTHIHHLLGKLHVKNRTEAIFLARRHLL